MQTRTLIKNAVKNIGTGAPFFCYARSKIHVRIRSLGFRKNLGFDSICFFLLNKI